MSSRPLLLVLAYALSLGCTDAGTKGTDPSETDTTDTEPAETDEPVVVPRDDGLASGSRLEVWTVDAPDGTGGVVTHLYDTELGVRCTFGLASDGVMRCLPEPTLDGTPGVFTDAACTRPALLVRQVCAAAGYTRSPGPDIAGCGGGSSQKVFRAGASLTGAQQVYFDSPVDGCTLMGTVAEQNVPSGMALVPLQEVSPVEFVEAGDVQGHVGASRISAGLLVSEDGAQVPYGMWDAERAAPCELVTDTLGADRCLPLDMPRPAPAYPDDTCDAADQLAVYGGVCEPADVVLWPSNDAGPGETIVARLFERLEEHTGTLYGGPTCAAQPSDPAYSLFLVGEEVPVASFAALAVVNTATGPVSRRWLHDAENTPALALPYPQLAPFWTQGSASRPCQPRQKVDGSWICLPEVAAELGAPQLFADDQCTRGVYNPADLPAGSLFYSQQPNEEACPGITTPRQLVRLLLQLGTPHTGDVWYRNDGVCTLVTAQEVCTAAQPCPVVEEADESSLTMRAGARP
jgi:hypothetical protein